MSIYPNSKMSSLYYSDEPSSENYPCVVKLNDDEIIVEYEDQGVVQYRGKNNGDGHFELSSTDVNGRASLHMFPNSSILEGSWVEDSYRGMWRILLE